MTIHGQMVTPRPDLPPRPPRAELQSIARALTPEQVSRDDKLRHSLRRLHHRTDVIRASHLHQTSFLHDANGEFRSRSRPATARHSLGPHSLAWLQSTHRGEGWF